MTNFWTEVMIYLDNAPLYSLEEIHIWNSVKSNVVQNISIFANLKSLILTKIQVYTWEVEANWSLRQGFNKNKN